MPDPEVKDANVAAYIYASPVGNFLLSFSGGMLVSLVSAAVANPQSHSLMAADNPCLKNSLCWLDAYFSGKRPSPFDLDFKIAGTPFQKKVWDLLMDIPYGQCTTYGELAKEITLKGQNGRMCARAVGGAIAKNPVWIAIPCHRVIRKGGAPGGYAGGVELKIALLRHEGVELDARNRA